VVDTNNSRIEVFDPTGAYLSQWGTEGTGEGQFEAAVGIAIDQDDDVFVSELFPNDRVQVFGDPAPTIADLLDSLHELGLPRGIESSLARKLEGAQQDLEEGDVGDVCGKLRAVVNEVRAQAGKKISTEAAAEFIAEVKEVGGDLGCPECEHRGRHRGWWHHQHHEHHGHRGRH
jgi:DNA-binding beta-propeller fold protein YncE